MVILAMVLPAEGWQAQNGSHSERAWRNPGGETDEDTCAPTEVIRFQWFGDPAEVRAEEPAEIDEPPSAPGPTPPSDSRPAIRVVKKQLDYISERRFRPVWWLEDESGAPLSQSFPLRALQVRVFRDDPSNVWEKKVSLTIHPGGIATYEWYWNASRSWADVATFRWTLLEDGYRFTADSIDSEIALE